MVLCHIWSCSSDIQFFVFQNLNLIYHPVYDRGMKIRGSIRGMTLGVLMVISLLVLVRIRTLASPSQQSVSGMNDFCFESESYRNWFQYKPAGYQSYRCILHNGGTQRHTTKLKREEWPSRLWTKCVTNNNGSSCRSDPPSVMMPRLRSVSFVKSNNK